MSESLVKRKEGKLIVDQAAFEVHNQLQEEIRIYVQYEMCYDVSSNLYLDVTESHMVFQLVFC